MGKDKPAETRKVNVAKGNKIVKGVMKQNGGKQDKAGRWDFSDAVAALTDENGK